MRVHKFFALRVASLAVAIAIVLSGCGGGSSAGNPNTPVEDGSASGLAAAAAGGALAGSSGSGTLALESHSGVQHSGGFASRLEQLLGGAQDAWAAALCPTYHSASGDGCTASGDSLWLSLDGCAYIGSLATWTGTLSIISTRTASCGHFPTPSGGGSLTRAYVAGVSSTGGGGVRVTSAGITAEIDDASPNLANFDGQVISPITAGGGYGAEVGFAANDTRDSVTIGHRLVITGTLDMSIAGQISVSEQPGGTSSTLSGQVSVYHNLAQVVATSTFQSVVSNYTCCLPVSGVITSTYSRGQNIGPNSTGTDLVGRTETLTLTGCGTGKLLGTDGSTQDVTLSRCF